MFLLDWEFSNLFEEASADPTIDPPFRCKGCGEIIDRAARKRHHRHHKRVESNRRARELQRTRERALSAARRARKHQAEGRTS